MALSNACVTVPLSIQRTTRPGHVNNGTDACVWNKLSLLLETGVSISLTNATGYCLYVSYVSLPPNAKLQA